MIDLDAVVLVAVGFLIGAYAAAIGVGGGFLIAPLLLLRHRDVPPETITAASLSVVALVSGIASSVGLRSGRIDRPVAAVLGLITIPAAVLGASGTSLLPRQVFALGFVGLLVVLAVYLTWRPTIAPFEPDAAGWRRRVRDRGGNLFVYRIPLLRSVPFAMGAAALAAFSGAGAGVLLVPVTTRVMRMPHWLAPPTAQSVIFVIALTAVVFHVAVGNVTLESNGPFGDAAWISVGVIASAPLGQRLNRRLGEGRLMRLLAIGLVGAAIRTLLAEI